MLNGSGTPYKDSTCLIIRLLSYLYQYRLFFDGPPPRGYAYIANVVMPGPITY